MNADCFRLAEERVIIALTKGQVLRPKAYREVIDALGSKADATLLLNGEIGYSHLSPYIKESNKQGVLFDRVRSAIGHSLDLFSRRVRP